MKKNVKVVLGIACAAVLVILAAFVLQIRIISLENGEKAIVYILPFGYRPGGSAGSDLRGELENVYGGEGVQTEPLRCEWQGEDAAVYDTSSYELKYLGRSFAGGDYISCKVTTVRTVILGSGETLNTERTSAYIGYDDADPNSRRRAHILWETLKEEYSDGEEYFNSAVLD